MVGFGPLQKWFLIPATFQPMVCFLNRVLRSPNISSHPGKRRGATGEPVQKKRFRRGGAEDLELRQAPQVGGSHGRRSQELHRIPSWILACVVFFCLIICSVYQQVVCWFCTFVGRGLQNAQCL